MQIDRDQRFAKKVVPRTVRPKVIAGRQLDGQVDQIEIRVHGDLSPHPGIASVGPGIVEPGVNPKLSGLRNSVEDPQAFARAHVEPADIALDVLVTPGNSSRTMCRADDNDVLRDHWCRM